MNDRIRALNDKIAALQARIAAGEKASPVGSTTSGPLPGWQNARLKRLSKSVAEVHPGVGEAVINEIDHDIELFMKSLESSDAAPPRQS